MKPEGTVLVTGAGGFIGSAVVRRLVAGPRTALWDGTPVEHVVALVRPGGSLERLGDLRLSPRWSVVRVDLRDAEALISIVRGHRARVVLHIGLDRAAHRWVLDTREDPLIAAPLDALFTGLAAVADARLVHTGSAWVLRAGERLSEEAAVEPRSAYARNKARAEALLPSLGSRSGVSWINLRLFNVFGRYEARGRLLPYLVDRLARGEPAALAGGGQVRDFTDVDAMAEAYALAIRAPEQACDAVYHIGSGVGTTTHAFARTVAEITGGGDRIRFDARGREDSGTDRLVADPTLARERLGWVPDTELAERIHAAARWWLRRLGLESVVQPAHSAAGEGGS